MKKLISDKRVLISIGLFVLVVLFFASGFRITYAPRLENDWNAIGACASWIAAVLSGVAIIVAVQIPKIISEEQNRIALFEKRYTFYDLLERYVAFSRIISNKQMDMYEICCWYETAFNCKCDVLESFDLREEFVDAIVSLHYDKLIELDIGVFLFEEDIQHILNELSQSISNLMKCSENEEKLPKCVSAFREATIKVEDKVLPIIRNKIRLK